MQCGTLWRHHESNDVYLLCTIKLPLGRYFFMVNTLTGVSGPLEESIEEAQVGMIPVTLGPKE